MFGGKALYRWDFVDCRQLTQGNAQPGPAISVVVQSGAVWIQMLLINGMRPVSTDKHVDDLATQALTWPTMTVVQTQDQLSLNR